MVVIAVDIYKTVKGATKIKMAAPKAKYIEPILNGTETWPLEELFGAISVRMRDSAWTVVYKSLIVVHIMIREGKRDVVLEYLTHHARLLDCKHMATTGTKFSQPIIRYSRYLQERVKQFAMVKIDYVRHKKENPMHGRLRSLTVDKGLLRETESVQSQMEYLLLCRFHASEVQDDITLTAFRLLVHDLLALHQAVNEAVINVLEHYFEMSKIDARRALQIYKRFVSQMDGTIEYLQVARKLESETRLMVPNIKHAPTSLTSSLEEYLNDPDFDVNRNQFLAQREAKRAAGRTSPVKVPGSAGSTGPVRTSVGGASDVVPRQADKQLIDFFSSIDNDPAGMPGQVQQMAAQMTGAAGYAGGFQAQPTGFQGQQPGFPPQQTGFQPQQTGFPGAPPAYSYGSPQPLSSDFTGAGFGGYSAQPAQPPAEGFFQPQATGQPAQPPAQAFFSQQSVFAPLIAQHSGLQPQRTGTNPFRLSMPGPPTAAPLTVQPTGKTNPFAGPAAGSALGTVPEHTGGRGDGLARAGTNPFARTATGAAAPLESQPTSRNPFRQSQPQPAPQQW
ncbi:ANTH domain-containing protein [Dipodascopsis tothii]|uniref:ANTH domain-containing protein n=1 Tax=Dipodascopsis tothii TaxID=44089 RepID=UPI0034CD4628